MSSFEKVQTILSDILKVSPEEITPLSQKSDFVQWDSLEHLNLIMEIEAQFEVSFTIDDIASIKTVEDILRLIS